MPFSLWYHVREQELTSTAGFHEPSGCWRAKQGTAADETGTQRSDVVRGSCDHMKEPDALSGVAVFVFFLNAYLFIFT